MKRFLTVGIIFGLLLTVVVAVSWFSIPGWQAPSSGGFWVLIGAAALGVISFVRSAVSIWKDLSTDGEDKSSSIVLPRLQLSLIDELGEYVDKLSFAQIANNQDFHFGIALVNLMAGSVPAEKFDIRIECSWAGTDIVKAPKLRFEAQNHMAPSWNVTRGLIQQGEKPYPAAVSFHGSANERCSHNHPLEWQGFSVVTGEKMEGRFVLKYNISGAEPRVEFEGVLEIRVDSKEFGTKSVTFNDIRTGEKLQIRFNLARNTIQINGIPVRRQAALESNDTEFVYCQIEGDVNRLYHLSRQQVEMMKSM